MDAPEFSAEFLARYEVHETLGSGGTAKVFRAHDRELRRDVAIKLLAPRAFSEPDARARFLRESQIAGQLKHPNVVGLLASGETCGRPYLVFEFISGPSLRRHLTRLGRIPIKEALILVRDVAAGLAVAQEEGVIHRDLKPDNVLLDHDGTARVTDFGLALRERKADVDPRLTRAGIVLGTPGYLAPEVIKGGDAVAASDVFSLGVMLHEMITGAQPFAADTDREMLVKYLKNDVPLMNRPGLVVPPIVEDLVARMTRRNVSDRLPDARAVLKELDRAIDRIDEQLIAAGRSTVKVSALPTRPQLVVGGSRKRQGITTRLYKLQRTPMVLGIFAAASLTAFGAFFMTTNTPSTTPSASTQAGVVVSDITVRRGVTTAQLRWKTNEPSPSSIKLWKDGQLEGTGIVMGRPDSRSGATSSRHQLPLRGLTAGTTYHVRFLSANGTPSSQFHTLTTRREMDEFAPTVQVDLSPEGRLLFTITDCPEGLTPGIVLHTDQATEARDPAWCTWDAPVHRWTVTLPTTSDQCARIWLAFKELEDIESDRTSHANQIRSTLVCNADQAIVRLEAFERSDPSRAVARICQELVRLPFRTFSHLRPGRDRLNTLKERLDSAQIVELRARLRDHANHWFETQVGLSSTLAIAAAARYLAQPPRTTSEAARRHRIYTAMARLSDLDVTCETIANQVPFKFLKATEGYATVVWSSPAPETVEMFRPLQADPGPDMAKLLATSHFTVFSRPDLDIPVVGLASTSSFDLDLARKVALARPAVLPGSPRKVEDAHWIRLPDVPKNLRLPSEALIVFLRTVNLVPDYRLWVRLGGRPFLIRAPSGYKPSLPNLSKGTSDGYSFRLVVPAAALADVGLDLALKMDVLSLLTTGGNDDEVPHHCWISNLLIAPDR